MSHFFPISHKHSRLLGIMLCFQLASNAQGFSDAEQNRLKQGLLLELPDYKKSLEGKKLHPVQVEFAADTFYAEAFVTILVQADNSDGAMSEATYAGAQVYDSLMNKYYKKLLDVLQGQDKTALVKAQRAWLAFRDAESDLADTISKDEYSGGGTMQGLTESALYFDRIKRRVIELFEHYVRATQSY